MKYNGNVKQLLNCGTFEQNFLGTTSCLGEKRKEKGMEIHIGDVLKLKKPHPCGSKEWEVLRVGADFRLKCLGCEHQIMIARTLLEKNIKEISKKA